MRGQNCSQSHASPTATATTVRATTRLPFPIQSCSRGDGQSTSRHRTAPAIATAAGEMLTLPAAVLIITADEPPPLKHAKTFSKAMRHDSRTALVAKETPPYTGGTESLFLLPLI